MTDETTTPSLKPRQTPLEAAEVEISHRSPVLCDLLIGDGVLSVSDGKRDRVYSEKMACADCGLSFPELTPQSFSFNSPQGMCVDCNGLGSRMEIDPDLVVPDDSLSLDQGAIKSWGPDVSTKTGWAHGFRSQICKQLDIDFDRPFRKLPKRQREQLLYGAVQFVFTYDAIHQSQLLRFRSCHCAPGENQIERAARTQQHRQEHSRHRRKATELDFRLAEAGGVGGHHKIAEGGKLHSTAQAVAAHGRDGNPISAPELAKDAMETAQHFRHAVGGVVAHIHAGGESALAAGENQEAQMGRSGQGVERRIQLLHGRNVQDVQGRAIENDSRHRAVAADLNVACFGHRAWVVAFFSATQPPSSKIAAS